MIMTANQQIVSFWRKKDTIETQSCLFVLYSPVPKDLTQAEFTQARLKIFHARQSYSVICMVRDYPDPL